MAWLQKDLDICQEALYLLRQDVDVPALSDVDSDSTLEWRKTKKAYEHAKGEILGSHDWTWNRSGQGAASISAWPADARNVLVYCTARELAIPLTGRIADMQNIDALYRDKLVKARVRDLESETTDDETAREVFAQLRSHFSTDDQRLPTSLKKIVDRIREVEGTALDEILGVHIWTSDVTGQLGVVYNALLGV